LIEDLRIRTLIKQLINIFLKIIIMYNACLKCYVLINLLLLSQKKKKKKKKKNPLWYIVVKSARQFGHAT
jgi:hypothetical protein